MIKVMSKHNKKKFNKMRKNKGKERLTKILLISIFQIIMIWKYEIQ